VGAGKAAAEAMDYVFDLQDKGEMKESRKRPGNLCLRRSALPLATKGTQESWNQGKINAEEWEGWNIC
jgi:hypothetical protein